MPEDRVALARRIIDFGLTAADLPPRSVHADLAQSVPAGALALRKTYLELREHWPDGLAPLPRALEPEPTSGERLPNADYLVITWTVAEHEGLADVLTPGVGRDHWYAYDRRFKTHYLPLIKPGAPARDAGRLGRYYLTEIGGKRVLCFKSELHLNQDGIRNGTGKATLPVADLFHQLIAEVAPKLVITTGTAGATYGDHHLGDVVITRAARFRLQSEFANEPYANAVYRSDFQIPNGRFQAAEQLLAVHAEKLTEPAFGPPTKRYPMTELLPALPNRPMLHVDEVDLPPFDPILTTDFFEFGTSSNDLEEAGCGVEMGDAVLGMVAQELADKAPRWLVVRNLSDPQINGDLPTDPDLQAMWAVWYYETFGYWTSVSSAIATWAVIAGD